MKKTFFNPFGHGGADERVQIADQLLRTLEVTNVYESGSIKISIEHLTLNGPTYIAGDILGEGSTKIIRVGEVVDVMEEKKR